MSDETLQPAPEAAPQAESAPVEPAAPVVEAAPEAPAAPASPTDSFEALKAHRTDLIWLEDSVRKVVEGGLAELGTFWREVVEEKLDGHSPESLLAAINEKAHAAQMAHQA